MPDDQVAAQLKNLTEAVSKLRAATDSLTRSADEIAGQQRGLRRDLDSLRDKVTRFIEEDRLAKARQFAQSKLNEVNASIDRKFRHYETTRRNALGSWRSLDSGFAPLATLRLTAEQQALQTRRYWLAPAQVALAAWLGGSGDAAQAALREARRRNPGKTALFFGLVKARCGREDAAACWVDRYLDTLDPRSLTPEFATVALAIADGAFGRAAREAARTVFSGWSGQLAADDELARKQAGSWETFILGQRQPLAGQFSELREMRSDRHLDQKIEWLEIAALIGQVKDWIESQLPAPAAPGPDRAASINVILQELVSSRERNEARLFDEAKRWQAVIAQQESHAEAQTPPLTTVGPHGLDFLTFLTDITQRQFRQAPSGATRFTISLSRGFIEKAMRAIYEERRTHRPAYLEIDVEGWTCQVRAGTDANELDPVFAEFAARGQKRDRERRLKRGQEKLHRAVFEVNRFYQRWQAEVRSMQRCEELLGADLPDPAAGPMPGLPSPAATGLGPAATLKIADQHHGLTGTRRVL